MHKNSPKTFTQFRRLKNFPGLELFKAVNFQHRFSRHSHSGYALGVIEQGALGFFYKGENLVASPGIINLVVPDEPHDGQPLTEHGWTYRMFYFEPQLLQAMSMEFLNRYDYLPFFKSGTIDDPDLAQMIRQTHTLFENSQSTQLERESGLMHMLIQFILRHADDQPQLLKMSYEFKRIARVCDYIQDNFSKNLTLNQLAGIAYLSPYHFLRIFQKQKHISPHAFLIQIRIQHAKFWLAEGKSIAQVAMETGFTDQSHFHRHFKRTVGITPRQYRNFVQ